MRARQLSTSASAVSSPSSSSRTKVVAARRFGSTFGMARPFTTGGEPVLSHTAAEGAFAKFVCGGCLLARGAQPRRISTHYVLYSHLLLDKFWSICYVY